MGRITGNTLHLSWASEPLQALAAPERSDLIFQALQTVSEAVYVTTPTGSILFVNAAFARLYGYTETEAVGRAAAGLGLADPQILSREPTEVTHVTRFGDKRTVSLRSEPIRDASGTMTAIMNIARDITDAKRVEDELRVSKAELEMSLCALQELAIRDELTGLFNRRELKRLLEEELVRAARTGKSVAVALLDLDYFKSLNDGFGHLAGDDVLQQVGALLRHAVRAYDKPCRYGGEEMLVVLPDTTADEGRIVAERLRRLIAEKTFDIRGAGGESTVQVTTSVGVAASSPGETAAELLRRADAALYEAKAAGRNCVMMAADAVA